MAKKILSKVSTIRPTSPPSQVVTWHMLLVYGDRICRRDGRKPFQACVTGRQWNAGTTCCCSCDDRAPSMMTDGG